MSGPGGRPAAVEVRDLVVGAGAGRGAPLLDGVDLAVRPGELVAVTGPSRTGKSALLEVLAGWRPPDRGTVVWEGGGEVPPWSVLTFVPQALALLDELTVEENATLAARVDPRAPRPDPDDLRRVLEALDVAALAGRGAREVSVGERQRVAVARALVGAPRIVVADEPVAHLDRDRAERVLDLLRARADAGAACVVASRDPAVGGWADRALDASDLARGRRGGPGTFGP